MFGEIVGYKKNKKTKDLAKVYSHGKTDAGSGTLYKLVHNHSKCWI